MNVISSHLPVFHASQLWCVDHARMKMHSKIFSCGMPIRIDAAITLPMKKLKLAWWTNFQGHRVTLFCHSKVMVVFLISIFCMFTHFHQGKCIMNLSKFNWDGFNISYAFSLSWLKISRSLYIVLLFCL